MASIRKRSSDRYQVQVRRRGFVLSRTFATREDAQRWARGIERRIDLGETPEERPAPTLRAVIERYRDEVAANQRREENAIGMLRRLLKEAFADRPLDSLSAPDLAAYRDRRLASCGAATVRRELGLLKTIVRYAAREWEIGHRPGLLGFLLPSEGKPRDRRLTADEWQNLTAATDPETLAIIRFALETGMRRGEIIRLQGEHANLHDRTLLIPRAKNGHPRTIPLSPAAIEILQRQTRGPGDPVFPISARALQMRWKRLVERAGIENLRFHDLRHEAVSRFFEQGLTIPEVALISGHRDPRMLFRYTHLRAEDVAKKLALPVG